MKPLSLLDVKQALWDTRFRDLFPEFKTEIAEFLRKPGCACNVEFYRKLMEHKDRMQQYFPTRLIVTPKEEMAALAKNNWLVINCTIDELQKELKSLSQGRKQLSIARWEDQITALINEKDGMAKNAWKVINCATKEVDVKMKELPPGQKQIAMARWQDQMTVVVNELEVLS